MKKWEYKTITSAKSKIFGNFGKEVEENLNELGKEGWELVAVTIQMGGIAYFKRELKE